MTNIVELLQQCASEIRRLAEEADYHEYSGPCKFAFEIDKAADELEKQEPVEYWVLHDSTAEKKYIKKSVGDGSLAFFDTESDAKRAQRLHGSSVGYSRVEYYRHPPTSAVPEGTVKVTDELLNFLFSVGHHGVPIGDEGQPYEISGDDIAYAQDLFTKLADIFAPQPGGSDDE